MAQGFEDLDPPYSVMLVDPPWAYRDEARAGERGAIHKYPTMTDTELLALPVGSLAADDCALFLWATAPRLDFAIQVLKTWGSTYKTVAFTWVKLSRAQHKRWHWGMGRWTRANPEYVLLGVKGRPIRMSASVHSVVEAPLRAHSQKPEEVRERIVQLLGDVHRVELFARSAAPGWDMWGLEAPRATPDTSPALTSG